MENLQKLTPGTVGTAGPPLRAGVSPGAPAPRGPVDHVKGLS
jgi:hypothetical protein